MAGHAPLFFGERFADSYGGRKTPQDFAVKAHLFSDAQNAYIFADVTDATPLNNPFTGNDIYKGDLLEVYFGFHREDEAVTFGAEDAQFGIGLAEQAQPTWMWTKGQELAGQGNRGGADGTRLCRRSADSACEFHANAFEIGRAALVRFRRKQ